MDGVKVGIKRIDTLDCSVWPFGLDRPSFTVT
jgi:hypothetical protein